MSPYWTAKPTASQRFIGHHNHLITRQLWLTVNLPAVSLGTPDQSAPRVIDNLGMRIEELLLQVVQRYVVELELPLEGAIGQASPALEHGCRLIENLLKGHR